MPGMTTPGTASASADANVRIRVRDLTVAFG